MTLLLVSGLSLVLMTKLFTAVDLLRENNTEFVLLKLIEILFKLVQVSMLWNSVSVFSLSLSMSLSAQSSTESSAYSMIFVSQALGKSLI